MKHLNEIYMRFHSEINAIQPEPINFVEISDGAFVTIDDAFAELEQAANGVDYAQAAKRIKHSVAVMKDVCKAKIARWQKWESVVSAFQQGMEDALKKDKPA